MKLKTLAAFAAVVAAVAAHGAAAAPAQAAMNDPSCKPAAAHPEPIVYVPGVGAPLDVEYGVIDPVLTARGFCTYGAELPHRNMGPLKEATAALAAVVDRVKQQTGASKVSLVGQSQGGVLARAYVKWFGPDSVADVVAIGAPQHGVLGPAAFFRTVMPDCLACPDLSKGSAFMRELNKGDDTPGSAAYTNIATLNEEFIPWPDSMLLGANTTNVLLQKACPLTSSCTSGCIPTRLSLTGSSTRSKRRARPTVVAGSSARSRTPGVWPGRSSGSSNPS